MVLALGVAGCRSSDRVPACAGIAAPSSFAYSWELAPDCRVIVSSPPAVSRIEWESCPTRTHGCRHIEFPRGQGPELGYIYGPSGGFDASGAAVVGLTFDDARPGSRRHIVLRADGSVPVAIDEVEASCQLLWLNVGAGWTVAAANAPDERTWRELSGPLDVRAATDLRAAPFAPATSAVAYDGPDYLEGPSGSPCSYEHAGFGTPPRIRQRNGRALALDAPPIGPKALFTMLAHDCTMAIALVTEPNEGATCFDMPGCGSRVTQIAIMPVVP